QSLGREADARIQRATHLTEHDERVTAACSTRTPSTGSRACCRRFAGLSRVLSGLDRCLQLLDIGQVTLAGSDSRRIAGRRLGARPAGKHLAVEGEAAVSPKGQLLTVGH